MKICLILFTHTFTVTIELRNEAEVTHPHTHTHSSKEKMLSWKKCLRRHIYRDAVRCQHLAIKILSIFDEDYLKFLEIPLSDERRLYNIIWSDMN